LLAAIGRSMSDIRLFTSPVPTPTASATLRASQLRQAPQSSSAKPMYLLGPDGCGCRLLGFHFWRPAVLSFAAHGTRNGMLR
jgi:hypothetical protein